MAKGYNGYLRDRDNAFLKLAYNNMSHRSTRIEASVIHTLPANQASPSTGEIFQQTLTELTVTNPL